MNIEEMNNRCFDLAEDHWNYIENLLVAHGESIGNLEIARFHYKEAFRHGYKHCWEDMYIPGQIVLVNDPRDYELSSYPNPKSNQAS
jgi:hypothetical protein